MKKLTHAALALLGTGCLLPWLCSCSSETPAELLAETDPVINGITRPLSVSSNAKEVFRFIYDDSERLTDMILDGNIRYTITYNPLTVRIAEGASSILLSDVITNKEGFITEATFYSEGQLPFSYTFTYDKANRILSMASNGINNFSCEWENGNLMKFHSHTGHETYVYSANPNPAGSVSPYWGSIAPLWLTGLFGTVPANYPETITQSYREFSFSYSFNPDLTISSENIFCDKLQLSLDYHYAMPGEKPEEDNTRSAGRHLPEVKNLFRQP